MSRPCCWADTRSCNRITPGRVEVPQRCRRFPASSPPVPGRPLPCLGRRRRGRRRPDPRWPSGPRRPVGSVNRFSSSCHLRYGHVVACRQPQPIEGRSSGESRVLGQAFRKKGRPDQRRGVSRVPRARRLLPGPALAVLSRLQLHLGRLTGRLSSLSKLLRCSSQSNGKPCEDCAAEDVESARYAVAAPEHRGQPT